jgi:hypothetical protein
MSAKTLAVAAVVLAASAIVAVKVKRHGQAEAAVGARETIPSVVLVADPREADAECGCGQIIRRVREAKARGLDVLELGPADPGAAHYGVTVVPTVLVLGADGRVVARREGESSETLATIAADLASLEGRSR